MASASHKKINHILKEADLPKALSDDLKRELESHFYEKEHDLQFSGFRGSQLQEKLHEDFGNEELVAKHLNFVHKKSFYSFIKSLMKNENKPSIFETVLIFIIIFFLYQNFAWDMATQVQMDRWAGEMRTFAEGGFINLGLFLFLNFVLIVRLFRGGAISQKLVASGLFVIMLGQMFYTYTLMNMNIIIPNTFEKTPEGELLEHPENYYGWSGANQYAGYNNLKDGYSLSLPRSYVAYLIDGTYNFPKNLKGDEEIIAFGPAYGSDEELIEVSVFDEENASDKLTTETWFDYFIKTQLKAKNIDYDQKAIPPVPENFGMTVRIKTNISYLELKTPINNKKDLLLFEKNSRLYSFLFDAKNSVHKAIFFDLDSVHLELPERFQKWVKFENEACPFELNLPSHWLAYKYREEDENFSGWEQEYIDIKDLSDCDIDGFTSPDTLQELKFERIKDQTLSDYIKNQEIWAQHMTVVQEGDTNWQGFPAKRMLLALYNDYDGKLEDSNVRLSALAVQLKKDDWLLFIHNSHAVPTNLFDTLNPYPQKILNSLVIKTPNETFSSNTSEIN